MFFQYGILINEVILMATIDERIEKLEEKKRAGVFPALYFFQL